MADYSGGVIKDAESPLKVTLTCKQYKKFFNDIIIGEKEITVPTN